MAKRGRPTKPKTISREDRYKYYRKKYLEKKRLTKDYGSKEYLKVLITKCEIMPIEMVKLWRPAMRHKLHRWTYRNQSGTIEIPESELMNDRDICEHVANNVGEGEWIIKSGGNHRVSKRCSWRALYRFRCSLKDNGDWNIHIIKIWSPRIRHYWWFKKRKEFNR